MEKIFKRLKIPLSVAVLVVLAFFLRTVWLKDNLFFGFEQGRDFLKMGKIVAGDLVLVGPNTDIPGVFHGALSYYIPLVPFFIFKGNPYWVLITYIAVNSISIAFLYKAVKEISTKKAAFLTSFFYAISYSSVIYSRWLNNPSLIPALVIFYFYFLVKAKDDWRYLVIGSMVFAVMVHLMVVVPLTLVIPTVVLLRTLKTKVSPKSLVLSVIAALLILTPYIIFEAKNNFVMSISLFNDQRASGNFLTSNIGFVDQFIGEVVDGVFPISPRIAFVLFMTTLFYGFSSFKNKKLKAISLVFLFSVPLLFIFIPDRPLRHFFIATPVFLSIFLGTVSDTLLKSRKGVSFLLTGTIVLGNFLALVDRIPETKGNFIHHAQRTYLGDMKNLIDWAYKDASGRKFTYDYYSMPYWKEDAWIYLFQWYGKGKYGYAPPVDRTNVERTEIFYTFIEPNETVPIHLDNWYGEFKKGTKLLDTYQSGKLKVEKRLVLDEEA